MAARTTAASNLDTTIGTLLSQFATYRAVAVSGEPSSAPGSYFLRSLFQRLSTDADLENAMREIMYAFPHYKPAGLNEVAAATIVNLDPSA